MLPNNVELLYFSHCIFPFARKILCQYDAAAAALSHPGCPEGGRLGDAGAASTFRGGGGPPRKPDNLTVIHSKLIKHLQMCHGDGGESSIHQRPPSPRRNLAASQSNYANEGGTARDGGRWRGGAVRGESDTLACAPPKRRKQILIHYVAGGESLPPSGRSLSGAGSGISAATSSSPDKSWPTVTPPPQKHPPTTSCPHGMCATDDISTRRED